MPDIAEVLRLDDKIIDLAKDVEILQALDELAKIFKERKAELSGMGVADVIDFLRSLEEDQALFDALGRAGLNADDLKAKAAAISSAVGRLSPEQQKLLRKISDFDEQQLGGDPGLVAWQLLDAGQDGDAGAYSFNLGASASMAFEAGDTWPGAGAQPDSLLRIGMAGNLEAGGSGKLPLKFGSVSASTDNKASASVDVFYDTTGSDDLYAAVAARRLGDLCNPFSLDSLWDAVAEDELYGVIAKVSGSTSFSVNIAVAEGFTLGEEVGAGTAELKVGASVSRSGSYDLTVRRLANSGNDAQKLEVMLKRESLATRGRSLSLEVKVDLEALAGRVRAVLERHQGELKAVLEEYQEFLTPGTYLQTRLGTVLEATVNEIVDDNGVKNALKEAFRNAAGLEQNPQLRQLRALVDHEVTGRLNELGTVITDHADRVGAEVANRIADRIGLDAGEAKTAIEKAVADAVEKIQGSLKEKVDELSDDALGELATKLQRAGANVSDAAQSADAALKGVREIIGKYEGLVTQLIKHTEDAARTKITTKLTYEESRTRGKVIDVSMTLDRNTPAAADAFETVLRGDMDGIIQLLQATPAGVVFDRQNMALTRFATIQKKLAFDVVFLGIELHTQSIFDADARITSDGAGRVSVESRATYQRRRDTAKEDREVRFVDAFELAAAKDTPQFTIDLGVSYEDEALKRKEIVRFLESYEDAALLPAGTTARAVEIFESWTGDGDDRHIKADINLGLALDGKASRQLMRIGDRVDSDLKDSARRHLFARAMSELVDSDAYEQQTLIDRAERILSQTSMESGRSLTDIYYDYTKQMHERAVGRLSSSSHRQKLIRKDLERARRVRSLCMSFVEFIDVMGDIYQATPGDGSNGTWDEDDYLDAQVRLNDCVKRWLKPGSKAIFWLSDDMHPHTVAFTGALIALASTGDDEAGGPALAVTMVRRDGTDGIAVLAG